MTNHHAALIYTMVLMAAADRDMTDAEMHSIGDMVAHLPVFRDFDRSKIAATAAGCVDLLSAEDGLDKVLAEDLRVPRHVIDVLLRVDRGHLAAQLAKALDDPHRGVAMAGVVRGSKAHWACADDRDVGDAFAHARLDATRG